VARRLVWIRWSTIAIALCVLASCQVRATVSVRVDPDGSGTVATRVHLDASAARAVTGLGRRLEDSVRLDDLAAAGWAIQPWVRDDSGGASLTMRKSFAGADELESVLRELGGDAVGVDVTLDRDRGVLRSGDHLTMQVDASNLAVNVASDDELAASLHAAGFHVGSSDAALTKQLARSLRIEVIASVAGDKERVVLRPGETVELTVGGTRVSGGRLVVAAVALAAVIVGLALLAFSLTRPRPRHEIPL
jgi:hypothetical protein